MASVMNYNPDGDAHDFSPTRSKYKLYIHPDQEHNPDTELPLMNMDTGQQKPYTSRSNFKTV